MILFVPVKYKCAVYGPNFLGWLQIVSIFIFFILFFLLTIIDFKGKDKKELFVRIGTFIFAIIMSLLYWIYQVYKLGNL
jgi:hypothetical protein